jgi:hypothetical protein
LLLEGLEHRVQDPAAQQDTDFPVALAVKHGQAAAAAAPVAQDKAPAEFIIFKIQEQETYQAEMDQ